MTPFAVLNLIGLAGRAIAGTRPAQPTISNSDLAELDFDKLLNEARTGNIASGKGVVLGAEISAELTTEQLDRLTAAADQAAAHGAKTALVLMDGQGYLVNVESRQVERIVDEQSQSVLTEVDAVITAPQQVATVDTQRLSSTPGNESLVNLLADAGH